jgi:hypothetical protein
MDWGLETVYPEEPDPLDTLPPEEAEAETDPFPPKEYGAEEIAWSGESRSKLPVLPKRIQMRK